MRDLAEIRHVDPNGMGGVPIREADANSGSAFLGNG